MCGDGARFARPTRCAEAHPIIAQAVRTAAVEARANRAVGGSVPRVASAQAREAEGAMVRARVLFARRGLGAPAEEAGGLPAEDEQDDPYPHFSWGRVLAGVWGAAPADMEGLVVIGTRLAC